MPIARVFVSKTSATPDDAYAFVNTPPPMLCLPDGISEVHVSVTFSWDKPRAEWLAEQWRALGVPVALGGPAYGQKGGAFVPGLYLRQGMTITSRGCPNHCWFCSVPKREGGLTELPIQDGYNVLDDNLLACSDSHVQQVFTMLARQKQRAVFTGGLEAKILKPWHAAALAKLKPKRMYFAYDTPDDYDPLIRAGKLLRDSGISVGGHTMCCYCLIGYAGDTFERAEKRLADTMRAGFMPYAMLYRDKSGQRDPAWQRFQREWLRPQIVGTKFSQIWRANNGNQTNPL